MTCRLIRAGTILKVEAARSGLELNFGPGKTEAVVRHSFDLKIPFNFTKEDVGMISQIVVAAAKHVQETTTNADEPMWAKLDEGQAAKYCTAA